MRISRLAAATAALAGMATLLACAPAAKWTEYANPAWGFAVAFPSAPQVADRPPAADNNGVHSLLVENKLADLYLAAVVLDASHTDKSADQIMSDVSQAMAKGGTLTQTYTAIGKTMGREVRIEKPGQATIRMRLFVEGGRLYEIGGQSPRGPKDERITRFMDSFRLLPK